MTHLVPHFKDETERTTLKHWHMPSLFWQLCGVYYCIYLIQTPLFTQCPHRGLTQWLSVYATHHWCGSLSGRLIHVAQTLIGEHAGLFRHSAHLLSPLFSPELWEEAMDRTHRHDLCAHKENMQTAHRKVSILLLAFFAKMLTFLAFLCTCQSMDGGNQSGYFALVSCPRPLLGINSLFDWQ